MVGPSDFHVDKPEGERWKVALELLAEGQSVRLGNLRLWPQDEHFRIGVESSWTTNITAATAAEDLARATGNLDSLLDSDPDLARVVAGRPVIYELIVDPGMGPVRVAELTDGALIWSPGFEPTTN